MVFIVNYAMDFILLTIADGFLKNNAGYRRAAMAAFIGAVWSCVSQTGVITNAVIRDIFTYVIISLIMAFICTKRQHGWKIAEYCRKIVKTSAAYIVTASVFGGIMGLIYNSTAAGHMLRAMALESEGLFICLLAAMSVMAVLLKHYLIQRAYDGSICDVEADFGKFIVNVKGIIDTGNVLVDNITGRPVHVMDKSCADRCVNMDITDYCCGKGDYMTSGRQKNNCGLGLHYVIFCSVGKEHGCMPVIMADTLTVKMDGKSVVLQNVPIGLSNTPLSKDGVYKILLNAEMKNVM
jgi:sigma-E processing peptidase SpoIIGA